MYNPRFFGVTIDGRIILVGGILMMGWTAYRSIQTGRVVLRFTVLAERSNDPVMFWVYVTLQIAAGCFCAALALEVIR